MWSFLRPAAAPGAPSAQRPPDPDDQERLVDAFIESYVSWREQCAELKSAYASWSSGRGDNDLAFAIYRAELEFEEHAAHVYRESAERLTRASGRDAHTRSRSQRGEACPTS